MPKRPRFKAIKDHKGPPRCDELQAPPDGTITNKWKAKKERQKINREKADRINGPEQFLLTSEKQSRSDDTIATKGKGKTERKKKNQLKAMRINSSKNVNDTISRNGIEVSILETKEEGLSERLTQATSELQKYEEENLSQLNDEKKQLEEKRRGMEEESLYS
mgnify:FL=1